MISVIGAGPAGSYAAYLLAKRGFDVELFEEHEVAGKPIQCTGIATIYLNDILKEIKIDNEEFLINTINQTRVYSPDGNCVNIKLKKNYIVDRSSFDQFLLNQATSEDVKCHCNKKFLNAERKNNRITMKFHDDRKETDVLIGADGPFSAVAKSFNLYGNRKFALGAQARMRMREPIDQNVVDFYIGRGFFGWLVPEDTKVARVGIASNDKAKIYFDALTKKRHGDILEWQSGPIPVYDPKIKTEAENVFLVGDAATQVKATTYGGIIPGLMAAEELSCALANKKSYQKLWKKRIGRELWLHLMMRKVLDRFSDRDCSRLISLVNQSKVTSVLTEHDREFPSRIIAKLLIKEPRFLSFFPRFLTSLTS